MRIDVHLHGDLQVADVAKAFAAIGLVIKRRADGSLIACRPTRSPVAQLTELRRLLRGPGSAQSPVSPKGAA